MSSPAVDVSSLFTVGSPSKSGQIEAIVVAALYFIPFCALTLQLPACKGKYHPVISTAVFAAARCVGYIFRALVERKVTKSNFEAYLILSSAATFLFIGSLGHLLAHWFKRSSGKGHLGYSIQVKALRLRLDYAFVVELLNYLGIAFAIVGIRAAFLLFTASSYSALVGAQQKRTASNRGFVALMGIYTVCAFACCLWSQLKGPTVAPRYPSRMLVISVLSVACGFLLVRTVFGLLSIDHHQYSNKPKLLYTLEVLPEMVALYTVAIPGFIPGIGRDAETQLGIAPTGTHASPLQVKLYHEDGQMSSAEEASHQQGKFVIVSHEDPSHDRVI
ncbi:hypothetical protein WJX77_010704 [Trebouxia sp. C0004]